MDLTSINGEESLREARTVKAVDSRVSVGRRRGRVNRCHFRDGLELLRAFCARLRAGGT